MSASFVAEIGIQSGTTSITLIMPGGISPGMQAIAFVANKLDSAPCTGPADWDSLGSVVVGTGVAGVGTGPLRISAFRKILTQSTTPNPVFTVTGGNVALGYGQVWSKGAGESWVTPTFTSGTETSHDLTWGTTGSANLGLAINDALAVISAGTANTGPTGRTITCAGTTLAVTGINSAGSAVGNALFIWGERCVVTAGASSGGPVSAGSHAANQSGGAGFVRLATSAIGANGGSGHTLTWHLNRLAGTLVNGVPTLAAAGAANRWAGTTGRELVGALNVRAGNTLPAYKDLQGVLNQLAGTTGLAVDGAAASIP